MSPATRYRFAATVFVAISLLLILVAAPSRAQGDRSGELQHMVNDLVYQLELIELFDRGVANKRLQQLAVAMDRWNTSTRNEADFETMRAWLESAIQASLPGRARPMPALPWFPERLARQQPVPTPQPSVAAKRPAIDAAAPAPTDQSPTLPAPDPKPTSVAKQQPKPQNDVPADAPVLEVPEPARVAAGWQRQPAAKPIDLGNPFADDEPIAPRTPSRARVALRPATVDAATVSRSGESNVTINVVELTARVRGYVHGLRGVEARLMASRDLSTSDLLLAVRELKQLAGQREFVAMYLDVVSPEVRRRIPELPSAEHAKVLATARWKELESLNGDAQGGAKEVIESMLGEL